MVRSFRYFALAFLAAATYVISHVSPPEGLTSEGLRALAVFFLSISLWVTQLLPLAITSLLAMVLIPVMGIMSSKEAFSLFGNSAVFFILGALILAAGMLKTGLSARLAVLMLAFFGGSSRKLVLGVFLTCAFLSFLMPEHAVAAMMFPIVLDIARGLGLKPQRSTYGKALFISMAWGSVIGGVATFLGGARNPLAIAILQETSGKSIGFFEWMTAVVPIVLVLLGAAYLLISFFYDTSGGDVSKTVQLMGNKKTALGRISYSEFMVGLIMLLTVISWIVFGESLGLANIAIFSVVTLFIFKLVSWKDVEEYVNWGIILMYGGAICLGYTLTMSGAAEWAGTIIAGQWATTPVALVVVFVLLSIIFTEGVSNAAIVAILLPLGLGLCEGYGVDPKIMTYAIAVPAGLAFMLPMGTPPTVIALSSGYLRVRDFVVTGLILKIIAMGIFLLMVKFYWPLIGINIG